MKCREFEDHVADIAGSSVMDAGLRAECVSHAEICTNCNALLNDHRLMIAGLHRLAEADKSIEAPAQLEMAMLEMFRNNHATGTGRSSLFERMSWKMAAAAAALIIALGISLSAIRNNDSGSDSNAPSTDFAGPTKAVDITPNSEAVQKIKEPPVSRSDYRSSRKAMGLKTVRNIPDPAPETERFTGREIMTDFMPVSFASEYIPIDSGHIIRVRMPRSALTAFGIPMSQNRANELVKADILVSNEGMTHAIRFVQ